MTVLKDRAGLVLEHGEEITQVLSAMEEGNSLRQACAVAAVSKGAFLSWVDQDDDLKDQYARARERMLDARAEELDELGELAAKAETSVEVNGLRLQSENRKWLLSKLAPKKYGDLQRVEHSGAIDIAGSILEARKRAG